MKSTNLFLGAAVALTMATAAGAQDVKVDFDKDANFAPIKTFAVKIGTSWGNPLGEKRVIAEIEEGIAAKGWTKAEDDKADAIVVLHGATEKKHSVSTFYSGGGYGGYRYGGWGAGSSTTNVYEYTVGTLVVDIFDAKSKALLWRGTASDELSDKAEKNAKKVEKASKKLFKDFPPGSAKQQPK